MMHKPRLLNMQMKGEQTLW